MEGSEWRAESGRVWMEGSRWSVVGGRERVERSGWRKREFVILSIETVCR